VTRHSVRVRLVIAAVLLVLSGLVAAEGGGIAQLRQFVEGTGAAQGSFEQVVTATSGRRPQHASGRFAFMRPGKFRWVYETPYPQVLVSDGERLWSWDPDLNQVTVNVLGDALGNTPAAILAGDGEIDRDFELSEAGASDGLDWVLAIPRQADSSFELMRIGLSGNRLKRMELRDHFGQTTVIDFTSLTTDVLPDAAQFTFSPPPGADVIGN
jgi:outer membrane lipoprotein carrier protein